MGLAEADTLYGGFFVQRPGDGHHAGVTVST